MHYSVTGLFEYTRSKVTEQDIIDFSPGDPGYWGYVKLWKTILKTGNIPKKSEFDLSEVIGLTGYAKPEEFSSPDRFRTYRRFTSAVGVALLHSGNCSVCVRPPNYLARDLIIDRDERYKTHLNLLRPVFREIRMNLIMERWEDQYPFFTFGAMILAQIARDWEESEVWAEQLVDDENAVRMNEEISCLVENDQFLLGLTNYTTHHDDWLSFAKSLKNPNKHEATQLVIDALVR